MQSYINEYSTYMSWIRLYSDSLNKKGENEKEKHSQ